MRIVAVVAISVTVFFVSGCQQGLVKKNFTGHAKCTNECIDVFHDAGGNIQLGPNDKNKPLSMKGNQVAEWYSQTDEEFTIVFDKPGGSPFLGKRFQIPIGGSVESGQVTAPYHGNVTADTYNYHVCDATKCIDPAVIITP